MTWDFESMPTLETERVLLREVHPTSDLSSLYELFADPRVARYTDTGPFTSMDDATEVMDWVGEIFAERRGLRWAICLRSDPSTLIGTAGFNHWDRENSSAEIGYDLAHRYWGRGLMTEILEPLLAFGFGSMALNRIEAEVTVGNDTSARVLDKLGFHREGLLRERGYWKGSYHDVWIYSRLRADDGHVDRPSQAI